MTGLTSARAAELQKEYGFNEIEEKRRSLLQRAAKALRSPVTFMLLVAAILSFAIGRASDGSFILALLVLNAGLSLWYEGKADNALEKLRARLAVNARVMRDGAWKDIPSRELVPGDYFSCGVGALVPADARVERAVNLAINEAVLTGEAVPKEKKDGDTAYSGSVIVSGSLEAVVTETGLNAFFGKIATAGGGMKRRSAMERDILAISRFLIAIAVAAAGILTFAFLAEGRPLADIAILDLSLLIAGIPVSLPTVMTLIVSLGALAVASKKALVRRLASLEDLANVTLLLTDKTGTLTENRMTVERVFSYPPLSEAETRRFGATAASGDRTSFIERAIAAADTGELGICRDFIPGDSSRKRSTAIIEVDGTTYLASLGTPPIIASLCRPDAALQEAIERETSDAAQDGSRAIALAIKENPAGLDDEKDMRFAGIFVLADPLRADAKDTLRYLGRQGVRTVMLTGDTHATAAHVADVLGLSGTVVVPASGADRFPAAALDGAAAFAEVFPDDKLALVSAAQAHNTVAVTGDGVNDLPAVRKADVGIAVANAVDALKASADIVLLDSNIAVLRTALIQARTIFFRLYNYSIYRISESLRLIITILVLGLVIHDFPLTPVQLILLAFLNDLPIITLAFDRVKRTDRPADLKPRERFVLGTIFGLVGVANSLILYFALAYLRYPLETIQTIFFLKLTVSGHMLIYVAHTREKWWRFLPSKSVIAATTLTQLCATAFAFFGFFVAPISAGAILFVWLWSFAWMQVGEATKALDRRLFPR